MKNIKVNWDDGDCTYTRINGTIEEIEEYYIGKVFNLGPVEDNLRECVSVEILD